MSESLPTKFYSIDFYCAVIFLHLDSDVPVIQCHPLIFISLIFIALIFIALIFIV